MTPPAPVRPRPDSPPEPEGEPARSWLPELALCVIGAEVSRYLDLPVRFAGLAFAAAGIVFGVLALRHLTRQAIRSTWRTLVLSLGMAAAVGLAVVHLVLAVSALYFPDIERCRDEALTRQAQDACQEELDALLRDLVDPGY